MASIVGYISQQDGIVKATLEDGSQQELATHMPVHMNDLIVTGQNGFIEIVLDNGNVITLGPNQRVLLDETTYESKEFASEDVSAEVNDIQKILEQNGDVGNLDNTAAGAGSIDSSLMVAELTEHNENLGHTGADYLSTSNSAKIIEPDTIDASINNIPIAHSNTYSIDEDNILTGNVITDDTGNGADEDYDGDVLQVIDYTQTQNGTLVIDPDGSFSYTPNENFYGSDSFTYTIDDGRGGVASATVGIDIASVNDLPVVQDNSYSLDEDTSIIISKNDLLSNDSDVDGDVLTIISTSQTSHGQLVDNGDGTYTYTPDKDYFGDDAFSYTVDDGNGGVATATVNINVLPVNDIPVAQDDQYVLDEDAAVIINKADLLGNDYDVDGDTLTINSISSVAHGTLVDNGDGTLTYTPVKDYNGSDSFEYTISDGNGEVDTATVHLTVNPVNDIPVAVDNVFTMNEDSSLSIFNSTLLSNDSDIDGDTLEVISVTQPSHGTLSPSGGSGIYGDYTYTPDSNFTGRDSFTYTISDGNGGTATATVYVDVLNVIDYINLNVSGDSSVDEGSEATYTVSLGGTPTSAVSVQIQINHIDTDNNDITAPKTLTVVIPAGSSSSSFSVANLTDAYAEGNERYSVSIVGFSGNGGFEGIQVGNGSVITTILDEPKADNYPTATDDTLSTNEDTAVVLDVLANDTDSDGTIDPTTLQIVTPPSHGSISVNPVTGAVTYTPAPDYNGQDSFTYTVKDNDGNPSNSATVNLTVNPLQDPPVAVNDVASTAQDTAVTINVMENDIDVDGNPTLDAASITIVTAPTNGTLTINGNGTVDYTPNTGYIGADSFKYTIDDNTGETSNAATVNIVVNSATNTPVAVDDNRSVEEDSVIIVDILANDSDPDNDLDPTSVAIINQPLHGSVNIDPATGAATYTPDPDYSGLDSFTYTVSDTSGNASNMATVSLTINPQMDPPITVNDTATTKEDTDVVIDILANDTDGDQDIDPSSVVIATNPSHGSVSVDPVSGQVTYTPNAGYNGSDSFSYTVEDANGTVSNLSTVAINVLPVADVTYINLSGDVTVNEGFEATYTLSLTNPPLSDIVVEVQVQFNASASSDDIEAPYTQTITIPAHSSSVDFNFKALSDSLIESSETYSVVITNVTGDGGLEELVVGNDRVDTTINNMEIKIDITDTDGSASASDNSVMEASGASVNGDITVSANAGIASVSIGGMDITNASTTPVVIAGSEGTLTVTGYDAATGAITYSYSEDGNSEDHSSGAIVDSFTVTVTDLAGQSSSDSLDIEILDSVPVAANDANAITEDSVSINGNVMSNDTLGSDSPTTVTNHGSASYGSITMNSDGSYTYTLDNTNPAVQALNNGESLSDTISYSITDSDGDSSSAELVITINGANDAPVALASQVVTLEDTVKTFNISEFGLSDVDDAISEAVQVRIDTLPVSGDLYFNGTAVVEGQVIDAADVLNLTFISDLNESGSDAYIDDVGSGGLGDQQASYASFEFSVSDGALWSESATMTIDVNADADAPTLSVTMTQKSEVAITSGNVTSTTGGFTVAAYAADGTLAPISIHDTPSGFGILGAASGDTDEIGYANGVGSEMLVVSLDDSVVSVDISFAWKHSSETAQLEFYKDGVKVGETVTHQGGSDSVDPAVTFQSTTGEAFDEIRFSALGVEDDYLIHEISFMNDENVGTSAITPEGTPITLHIDPALVDTDGSESLSVTISEAPEGAVFSDGVHTVTVDSSGIADITGWDYGNVTFVMPNVNADMTYQMSVNATSTEYSNPGVTPQQLHQESVSVPLSITVTNITVPTAPTIEAATTTVSEEGLVNGIADTKGSSDTTNSASSSGTMAINDVNNDPLYVSLSQPAGTYTSHGDTITWILSNNNQTLMAVANSGSSNERNVFVVTIDNNGNYVTSLLDTLDHPNAGTEDTLSIDIGVGVSDGDFVKTSTLSVVVEDDAPYVSNAFANAYVEVDTIAVTNYQAGFTNAVFTNYSSSNVTETNNDSDSYIDEVLWGTAATGNGKSGYTLADTSTLGTTAGEEVHIGDLINLGTFTHHNWPIYSNSSILETINMVIEADVIVNGSSHHISMTLPMTHTETDNSGADPRDIITLPTDQQSFMIDGVNYTVKLEGFMQNGVLVNTIYTDEEANNEFTIYGKIISTDPLPIISGTVLAEAGADDTDTRVIWSDTSSTKGIMSANDDGTYSFEVNRETKDSLGSNETQTETFDYYIIDKDGDRQEGTLTIQINGVDAMAAIQAPEVNGSGDDSLLYAGTDMDAGEGNDTLLLANNVDLDFSNVANLSNFEQIDLTANGDHQITNLTMQDVLDITAANNELVIYGDDRDAVSLQNTAGNSWSKAPTALEENGHLFDVYTNGSATVKVEQDINDNITS